MSSSEIVAVERRAVQRFQTNVDAELASGSCLAAITIHDISAAGCGIEISTRDADLAEALGAIGLLQMPAVDGAPSGSILPVTLCNMRVEGGRLLYGLQFRRLLPHQTRKLVEIMHAVIPEKASGGTTACPATHGP